VYLGGQRWVALVDLAEAVQHLGKLRRVDGLHRDLDHRRRVELERPEDLGLHTLDTLHTVQPCAATLTTRGLTTAFNVKPLRCLWAL